MNYEWAILSHSFLSLIHVVYIKSESSGRWKLELFETKKRCQLAGASISRMLGGEIFFPPPKPLYKYRFISLYHLYPL